MKTLMKCGHVVFHNKNDPPTCSICIGILKEAEIPDEINENMLEGRYSKCSYCKQEINSNLDLPFFEYQPGKEKDRYYCGCKGWD